MSPASASGCFSLSPAPVPQFRTMCPLLSGQDKQVRSSEKSTGVRVQPMLPGAQSAYTALDNRDGPYLGMPQAGLKLTGSILAQFSLPEPSTFLNLCKERAE